jgi:hypothetical protein
MDIHAGLLTVEYLEGSLLRSITLRVPPEEAWSTENQRITFK